MHLGASVLSGNARDCAGNDAGSCQLLATQCILSTRAAITLCTPEARSVHQLIYIDCLL